MLARLLDRILPRTRGQAFAWAFGLALIGGLAIILILRPLTGMSSQFATMRHDGYWQLASNVGRGEGYVFEPGGAPVIHRPPLVPCLFAPLTFLPANLQRPGVVLLQSLIVGATCWLLFDLASRSFAARIARYSVGLFLVYPWLYWHVKDPMNVVTQTMLACLMLDLMLRELLATDARRRRATHWLLTSVLLGAVMACAMLTHGTMLLSIPLILLLLIGAGIALRNERPVRVAVVAGVVTVACVAPWTSRNWKVSGRFIPVVSNSGYAYFWGNAHWRFPGDRTTGKEPRRALVLAGIHREFSEVWHFSGLKDPEVDRLINRRMAEHIRAHPAQFAEKVLLNAAEFYFPVVHDVPGLRDALRRNELDGPVWVLYRLVVSAWHGALWVLALVGLRRQRRPTTRGRWLLALACVVLLAIPYFPFLVNIAHSQYVFQTMPLVCLLAASGLVTLLPVRETGQPDLDGSRLASRGCDWVTPAIERIDGDRPGSRRRASVGASAGAGTLARGWAESGRE